MSEQAQAMRLVRKLVLVFDICSSTSILEDLLGADNLQEWYRVLTSVQQFLEEQSRQFRFEVYKFIGDGWILLFDDDGKLERSELLRFLSELCKCYEELFLSLDSVLTQAIKPVGLTFGVASGDLVRLEMNGQAEYVGKAINVASRLQTKVKDLVENEYRILFTKPSYNTLLPKLRQSYTHLLSLRNLSDGRPNACIAMARSGPYEFALLEAKEQPKLIATDIQARSRQEGAAAAAKAEPMLAPQVVEPLGTD